MLGDALGGLLTAAGVAASAGVARVVFARADAFGAAERAKAKTAKALRLEALGRLAARAGADVHADFRDAGAASVTVARARDAVAGPTSGPYRVSAAAAAAETHACRRIGAPARVGPPLRLDAAWRALRRRLDSRRPETGKNGGDTGGDAAEEPPSPATAAAAALSPVEEAVRAAEAAAAATPAAAPLREVAAEERRLGTARARVVAATPAERRDAAATGVALVTPEATPATTPARTPVGTPSRPAKTLDFDDMGKAADLATLAALTPGTTPRGTPGGTPRGTPARRAGPSSVAAANDDAASRATRAFTLEEYARAVTKLEGKKEALLASFARLERRRRLEDDDDGEAARDDASALEADDGDDGDEGDEDDDDASFDPETSAARRAVVRLHRQCATVEAKLHAREAALEDERARLSRRERELESARARKAARHLSSSMRRRALLAWVLYLDAAVKRRRLLRRAATKMRLRATSAAFESWLEYARLRRASRAERRLEALRRRAEQAEALEMEARRAKAAAAAKAAETASLVADAEAREARARREVEAMRASGRANAAGPGSDSE